MRVAWSRLIDANRSVRDEACANENNPQLCSPGLDGRKTDAWSLVCMSSVHIFKQFPDRTTRKKVMVHNVLPFFRSPFLTQKRLICPENFKKKSSRDAFFKNAETRQKFTLKTLYFWNRVSTVLQKSSRLDFVLKFSDRVKFHPTPIW